MARFDHLPLLRLTREEPRRLRPGFGTATERDVPKHARKIRDALDALEKTQQDLPKLKGVDASLILKVTLTNSVDEDYWRRAGFQVLAQNEDDIYVLFSSDGEMKEFRQKLAAFQEGPKGKQKTAPHTALFCNIETAGALSAEDRIGPRLKQMGITTLDDIDGRETYVVDVEIWDADTGIERRVRVDRIEKGIKKEGGEVIGAPYIGSYGVILVRLKLRGALLKTLLQFPDVASIDVPVLPDLGDDESPELTLKDIPDPVAPEKALPLIGIIDSGLNAHPLLDPIIAKSIAVPDSLGANDAHGHGTKVVSIAAYGDVGECAEAKSFEPPFQLMSVRVVNDEGRFDDVQKLPEQMREAVKALAEAGCRVINMSLGDKTLRPYGGGRATPWAAELDTLAREFDVLIIVSAGNSKLPGDDKGEKLPKSYPKFLTDPSNRLVDPAIAANVLTVGAIAHGNGLRVDEDDGVQVQPITDVNEPSPVTRCGPGINNAIKPELSDFGGTVVYNGNIGKLVSGNSWSSAGVMTLSPNYRRSLFTTAAGTSFAAPRVAFKAGLLFSRFPEASASLIRALLAVCAEVPGDGIERFPKSKASPKRISEDVRKCMGYGVPNVERALSSEEKRVILVADRQEMYLDQMALYAVPLPEEFRTTKGKRFIRVSLAFAPPVRHTRMEYLGTRMSFHLVRGLTDEQIYEHFKRREDKTKPPSIPEACKCKLDPGFAARETSTLQCGTFTISRDSDYFQDTLYLAVFTHRRWAGEDTIMRQSYALAVELEHEGVNTLYQRCEQFVQRLRAQANIRVP